jgi:hypothetical protein
MKTIEMVAEFQMAFDVLRVAERPTIPDVRTQLLRTHLLTEELGELAHAFCASNLVKVLDAFCDLRYVIDGTTLVCGVQGQILRAPNSVIRQPPIMPVKPMEVVRRFQRSLGQLCDGFMNNNLLLVGQGLSNLGLAVQLGVEDCGMTEVFGPAFAEVHRSNLSKLGSDGKPVTDGAGRVVKGPNYSPAQLEQFIP